MDVSHLPCTKWYKALKGRGCEKVWRNRASLLHADTQPAPAAVNGEDKGDAYRLAARLVCMYK